MKTLLTLLLTVLTGYSATYSGVVSGNNLGNQNSTGTNITIKGLKGWSTNFNGTNMTFVGGSFTGATNTGGVYSGGAYTGTLTGTNAVLTTPSITGGTNTGSLITGATITGGTVASALTGTNANLTTPTITGATLSGTLSGGTFSGGSFAGSLASTNAVLTTPSVTGGTNTSSLFLNSTLTGFTSSLQTNTDLTASKVLVSDSAKRITNSTVSTTTLGYLDATSSIQTQLNAKLAATNGTASGGTFTGATNINPVFSGNIGIGPMPNGSGVARFEVSSEADYTFGSQTNVAFIGSKVSGQASKLGVLIYHSFADSRYKAGLASTIYGTSGNDLDINTGDSPSLGGMVVQYRGNVGLKTADPQYQIDINGQARILGTNGMRFGGTSGVTDDTVSINQPSANVLRLNGTSIVANGTLAATNGTFSGGTFTGATNVNGVMTNSSFLGTINRDGLAFIRGSTALHNIGVGEIAGNTTASGFSNTGLGYGSLMSVTSGTHNSALGSASGWLITSGTLNTTVGSQSGLSLSSGSANSLVGYYAGQALTDQTANSAFGSVSLYFATNANYTTAIGQEALYDHLGGDYNTAIGASAGRPVTYGQRNTFLGALTTASATNLTDGVAIGYGASFGANYAIALGGASHSVGIRLSAPQYPLDIGGQARIIGTNTINFGGTPVAADATTYIREVSSGIMEARGTSAIRLWGNVVAGSASGVTPLGSLHASGSGSALILAVNSQGNSPTANLGAFSINSTNVLTVMSNATFGIRGTITAPGTTGAQTINKPVGSVNLEAGATSLVVTDSCVGSATDTIVLLTVGSNDTTTKSCAVVVGTGQFTIYPNAAPTAETVVFFQVIRVL